MKRSYNRRELEKRIVDLKSEVKYWDGRIDEKEGFVWFIKEKIKNLQEIGGHESQVNMFQVQLEKETKTLNGQIVERGIRKNLIKLHQEDLDLGLV